jgi:hypothetical protein
MQASHPKIIMVSKGKGVSIYNPPVNVPWQLLKPLLADFYHLIKQHLIHELKGLVGWVPLSRSARSGCQFDLALQNVFSESKKSFRHFSKKRSE